MSWPIENFFPLFDMLQSRIDPSEQELPLTEEQMKYVIQQINLLDPWGREIIYVILRIYSLRYSDTKVMDIPYGGEKLSEKTDGTETVCNVKFDVQKFPPLLSRMLAEFSALHLKKCREDAARASADKKPPPT